MDRAPPRRSGLLGLLVLALLVTHTQAYEKTLRKIVRSQSKMVVRPFSDHVNTQEHGAWKTSTSKPTNRKNLMFVLPPMKTVYNTLQRPKFAKFLTSIEKKGKISYTTGSKSGPELQIEQRLTRNTIPDLNVTQKYAVAEYSIPNSNKSNRTEQRVTIKTYYHIPTSSKFFPPVEEVELQNLEQKKGDTSVIPSHPKEVDNLEQAKATAVVMPQPHFKNAMKEMPILDTPSPPVIAEEPENESERAEFQFQDTPARDSVYGYNLTTALLSCPSVREIATDLDAQQKFGQFNIEPPWVTHSHYWNSMYNGRYEALMKNPKWPPLKVILILRSHVDTIWKKPFEDYHKEVAGKIISNVVKKLQLYHRISFSWNEVSHLSRWWDTASHRSRSGLKKLVKSGRFEITNGGWVEPDEATTHLFGLLHQHIEGHQWLKQHLNYTPTYGWLTNTVTHSPTMTYILAASNIYHVVFTNVHFAWEQFLAEFQYSDFFWLQNWDHDKTAQTRLNEQFGYIGNDKLPKHTVLTHYLQFNSAGIKACGPNHLLCTSEYNFGKPNMKEITSNNIREKAEALLEQYSKTGTISSHNVIIAPVGGLHHFVKQPEFDYQYGNYQKIVDYVNTNNDTYKATIEFGTVKDYFSEIVHNKQQKLFPTLKGDFLNFADIISGSPAYWTGFYTSRPFTKILMRRLFSTLRTTEILFSFALQSNVFRGFNMSKVFELLIKSRESAARLMDRNVMSGTVTAAALLHVHNEILTTVRDCWYIQELAASFMTLKPDTNKPYLNKYVYRDGEFISVFKSVNPGDYIYIFNSLSHDRTEIVQLITRTPKVRVLDHNRKDVSIQINPVWTYHSDNVLRISKQFYKINFAVMVPPMTLELFKIKETYDASKSAATIYCLECIVDDGAASPSLFPFDIQPIQPGDIQLESYKYRLFFDETSGFLKTVTEKETNAERSLCIDYGAFKDSYINSGMFLFNTDVKKPLNDMLAQYRLGKRSKIVIIVSGVLTTEITIIYGRLLQHTTTIYNLLRSPLSSAIYVESKVDYDTSPKNRELEMFLSIQTDIANGNPPKIFTDNNGFQFTPRILNISRRVESNMYPITTMAFIQDKNSRLTFLTDHAQGVTALQEGQLVVMLDRRVLFNDGRGTNEGLADSGLTCHRSYILLENFFDPVERLRRSQLQNEISLPSLNALHLSNTLDIILDIYLIDRNYTGLCNYMFLPLVKSPFPCDVAVVNFRVVLNKMNIKNSTPVTALMVLHRQSFSCHTDRSSAMQCSTEPDLVLDRVLRNVKTIFQTNLPGTSEGERVFSLNHVNFPPMELTTLRIYFN